MTVENNSKSSGSSLVKLVGITAIVAVDGWSLRLTEVSPRRDLRLYGILQPQQQQWDDLAAEWSQRNKESEPSQAVLFSSSLSSSISTTGSTFSRSPSRSVSPGYVYPSNMNGPHQSLVPDNADFLQSPGFVVGSHGAQTISELAHDWAIMNRETVQPHSMPFPSTDQEYNPDVEDLEEQHRNLEAFNQESSGFTAPNLEESSQEGEINVVEDTQAEVIAPMASMADLAREWKVMNSEKKKAVAPVPLQVDGEGTDAVPLDTMLENSASSLHSDDSNEIADELDSAAMPIVNETPANFVRAWGGGSYQLAAKPSFTPADQFKPSPIPRGSDTYKILPIDRLAEIWTAMNRDNESLVTSPDFSSAIPAEVLPDPVVVPKRSRPVLTMAQLEAELKALHPAPVETKEPKHALPLPTEDKVYDVLPQEPVTSDAVKTDEESEVQGTILPEEDNVYDELEAEHKTLHPMPVETKEPEYALPLPMEDKVYHELPQEPVATETYEAAEAQGTVLPEEEHVVEGIQEVEGCADILTGVDHPESEQLQEYEVLEDFLSFEERRVPVSQHEMEVELLHEFLDFMGEDTDMQVPGEDEEDDVLYDMKITETTLIAASPASIYQASSLDFADPADTVKQTLMGNNYASVRFMSHAAREAKRLSAAAFLPTRLVRAQTEADPADTVKQAISGNGDVRRLLVVEGAQSQVEEIDETGAKDLSKVEIQIESTVVDEPESILESAPLLSTSTVSVAADVSQREAETDTTTSGLASTVSVSQEAGAPESDDGRRAIFVGGFAAMVAAAAGALHSMSTDFAGAAVFQESGSAPENSEFPK